MDAPRRETETACWLAICCFGNRGLAHWGKLRTALIQHLNHRRRALKMVSALVAIALVGVQALAEWHVEGDDCPEECCVLCAHSDPGSALDAVVASSMQQPVAGRVVLGEAAAPFLSRPFENRPSRAPPSS